MLATKTGIRRHGDEQGNYRNLAWLGRPANVASKLTDAANKPAEYNSVPRVSVAYENPSPFLPGSGLAGILCINPSPSLAGSGLAGVFGALSPNILATTEPAGGGWKWVSETLETFVSQLEVQYVPARVVHKSPNFASFYMSSDNVQTRDATPPILMTAEVWSGFRKAEPNNSAVQNSLFKKVNVSVPGYSGQV